MKKLIVLVMLCALALTASFANAATQVTDVLVQAAVIANCSVAPSTGINFNQYDPTSPTDTTATGTVTITCTKGTSYNTYLAFAPGDTVRQMTAGANVLPYQVYSDSGYSSAYPSANPASPTVASSNAATPITLYGKIAAGVDVPVANYAQTLKFTIEY